MICKSGCMRPNYLLFMIMSILLTCGVGMAVEWSEEVQMTHAETHYMDGRFHRFVVDSESNLHGVYNCNSYDDEELNPRQPVYQKFSSVGEAISEMLPLGRFVEFPDSERVKAINMCIDDNDNIHVLWGHKTLHITTLNIEGEVVDEDILLQGIEVYSRDDRSHIPSILIDSHERYVLFGQFLNRNLLIIPVAYGRFTQDGELLDTLIFLERNPAFSSQFYMELSDNNFLHLAWRHNTRPFNSFYAIADEEDEIIQEPMLIPDPNGGHSTTLNAMHLAADNLPVFYLLHNSSFFLIKLNDDLELDFASHIGDAPWSIPGSFIIDNSNTIHVASEIDEEEVNNGRHCMGYSAFDNNGERTAGVDVITDGRYGSWSIFSSNQNMIYTTWMDSRTRNEDEGLGAELFMRYTDHFMGIPKEPQSEDQSDDTGIIIYPNPGRDHLVFKFNHIPSNLSLSLFDLQGRLVYSNTYPSLTQKLFTVNLPEQQLPSGNYMILIKTGTISQTRYITLIR